MPDMLPSYLWVEGETAFGAPGSAPRWTSSTKDLVGTAYSASSRVWYTLSHGTLNEIYYPTIDRPQVRDMELLFTDGETFFHEEKRDLKSEFAYIDPGALAVQLINSAPDGSYRVIKQVISDPHYPTVLMRVWIEGEEERLKNLQVFALLAPHLEIGGANNNGRALDMAGQRVLLAWKGATSLAMGVSGGFGRTSIGYVGESDGWTDLHLHNKMEWEFAQALDGNIAMMGEIDIQRSREFTIGISFGDGHHGALSTLMQSLARPVDQHLARFVEQWHRVNYMTALEGKSEDEGRLLRVSHGMVLAHEDKTFAGAFIASASIPWGQSKGDEDLGGYHLVWTRDMVQTATALLAGGFSATALRALVYLACSQRPDGSFAQNFWVNGNPYWGGIQLDEVAFPILLTWRLWKAQELEEFDMLKFVLRAANFLVRQAPVTQQERWEENAGYSPSTLAVVITGLICAADISRSDGGEKQAVFLEEYADWIEENLEDWTVTNDGVLLPEVKRHYMRIRPPQCGDPYAMPDCDRQIVHLSNQPPGQPTAYEAREIIDAGFLELVRYGVRAWDDPLIVDSLKVVDAVLKRETPRGPAWRRYNHDGYGQQSDGGPYTGYGEGRCWPLLGGERAHYEVAAGRDPQMLIATYERFVSRGGMLPEQIWDAPDIPELGLCFGKYSGSAMPLVWAHAEYLKLLRSATDGKVFDSVDVVKQRYQVDKQQGKTRKNLQIFKRRRHVNTVKAGGTLRIVVAEPFRTTWTNDGWKTKHEEDAQEVGILGWTYDIDVGMQQTEPILFTLYWPQENRWEGQDYTVNVIAAEDDIPAPGDSAATAGQVTPATAKARAGKKTVAK